jgi:FAD:protein FMN transferase
MSDVVVTPRMTNMNCQTGFNSATIAMKAAKKIDEDDVVFHFVAMASDCEIRVAAMPSERAQQAAQAAIVEINRIEAKYSRYRPDSVIAAINGTASALNDSALIRAKGVLVDSETAELLNFAANLYALSDGLFDVTSGVLRNVWNFRAQQCPDRDDIARVVALIGWHRVQWDGERIALPLPGMEIDFGGFGKEYAADRAAAVLINAGVSHAIVNLGGDVRVIGARQNTAPWQLGIRHPRQPDRTIASIALTRSALATSGDYERFFDHDGRRYCHIINPRTGWPVSHWQSISVIAPVCAAAGALATIAMLMEGNALDFLRAQSVGFLAIDSRGEIVSEQVANAISPISPVSPDSVSRM